MAPLHGDDFDLADDEMNQAIVTGLLRHAGHRVSVASNVARAIAAMAQGNLIDMVLRDWQMPDMDGLEVTRRLRAGQAGVAGQRVPIVALTAIAFAEDRAACLAAGMNDFLSKPILWADLLAAVAHSTAGALRAIQAAERAADKELLHRLLHTLKSARAGVGAMAWSAQCAAGGAKLRQGIAAQAELPTQLQQSF